MNVGIIGLGGMGVRHAEAVQKLGGKVLFGVDKTSVARDNFLNQFKLKPEQVFESTEEVQLNKKLHGVIIATTAVSHAQCVQEALKLKSKWILCEKPMASSVQQCEQMMDACKKKGVRLAINHQRRMLPLNEFVQKIVKDKNYGAVTQVSVFGGNGGIAMLGSHVIDYFLYLTKSSMKEIMARLDDRGFIDPRGSQYRDFSGTITGQSVSGVSLTLDLGKKSGHGFKWIICFEKAQIIADELSGQIWFDRRKNEFMELPPHRYGTPGETKRIPLPKADVIDSCQKIIKAVHKGVSYPSGEEAKAVIEVLVAAIESSESRKSVLLPIKKNKAKIFLWP